MRPGALAAAVGLLAGLGAGLAACRAPPSRTPGALAAPGRFPHALGPHAALACTSCHGDAQTGTGHAACAACHGGPFAPGALATLDRAGGFCAGCHQPTRERLLPSRFSHRLHLDRGRMEQTVGFHLACQDCHDAAGGRRAPAGHAVCVRCHESRAPALAGCTGCHGGEPPAPLGRRLARAGLRFDHDRHERDRVGREIVCLVCHDQVGQTRTVAEIAAPGIARCTECHEDRRQTPVDVRMSQCQSCHLEPQGALAPRSHQLGTLAPDDHTLLFRREHADAARAPGARCAACHPGLSGSVRDSCAECHAVMRPHDHTITWREEDHGREAAATRDRCASCHAGDFCQACHSVAPRSHLPRAEWRLGHASAARLGLRACFGCHQFAGAGDAGACAACHSRGLR